MLSSFSYCVSADGSISALVAAGLAVGFELLHDNGHLLVGEYLRLADAHCAVLELGDVFHIVGEGEGAGDAASADDYAVICEKYGVGIAADLDGLFRKLFGAEGDIRGAGDNVGVRVADHVVNGTDGLIEHREGGAVRRMGVDNGTRFGLVLIRQSGEPSGDKRYLRARRRVQYARRNGRRQRPAGRI